jgi:hypothetical protein
MTMWIRLVSAVLILVGWTAGPLPSAPAKVDLSPALAWLRSQQGPDGGFSNGFSEGSDPGTTADTVVAIASAGDDPSTWTVEGTSPLDYLSMYASEVDSPGLAAKLALAVVAAGKNPRDFGGINLVDSVRAGYDSGNGFFGGGPYDTALGILALRATDEPLPDGAIERLVGARLPDGSYSFSGDMTPGGGDSNTTALVFQALLAAGAGAEVGPSLTYFRKTQNADGGWTYQKPSAFGEDTDANSTALVVQALLAGGQDLSGWGHPLQALEALQQESGAFAFNAATPGDNLLATIQAIPALAGVDLTDAPTLPVRFAGVGRPTTSLLVATLILIAALLAAGTLFGRARQG